MTMRRCLLYVHFPYCVTRCNYCDFNTYEAKEMPLDAYTRAILAEGRHRSPRWSASELSSIFLGGGTPSLWGAANVAKVLRAAMGWFPNRSANLEVTLECNPAEVNSRFLAAYRAAGVNRLSLGIQSLHDALLKRISRRHSGEQAMLALRTALDTAFDSVSADLMYGLPGQTLEQWTTDLKAVADTGVPHISAYHLTLETGTALTREVSAGRVTLPAEEEQNEFWEAIEPILSPYGYELYEISNLAQPGHESRHNQGYWQGHAYLGLGAGAHSLELPEQWDPDASVKRTMNARQPQDFMKRVLEHGHGEQNSELLDIHSHLRERMFTGLRQLDGICMAQISADLGIDPRLEFAAQLESLVARELVMIRGDQLSLTRHGLRFANDVFLSFF
ncbi:MAG TPA: radical SAM family heme chaperone HemW [Myxococcales bacterium]|nr:radical SAM family heme chaperone HemW [Myxococcales bacterium]